MNSIPYILTDNSVTIVVKGKPYTMADSHASFAEVKNRIATQDFDGIERLFNPVASVTTFTKGNIVVEDGVVLYKGKAVNNHVVDRILQFVKEGLPYKPLVAFLENLLQNPSFRAVTELYGFLEASKLPITDDGCFLAYRKVSNDFKDFYTGTIDNSIGQVVKMERNMVDEDKNRTCSYGLHFCAFSYLSQYHGGQGRSVIVKINPANVIAIPTDYNNAKGRCCEYAVISEIPNETEQNYGALYLTSPDDAFDDTEVEEDGIQESYDAGYAIGAEHAGENFVRDAEDAFLNQGGNANEEAFDEGYHDGYDDVSNADAKPAVAAKVKPVVSDATRRKLRRIAKSAKRDSTGRFI